MKRRMNEDTIREGKQLPPTFNIRTTAASEPRGASESLESNGKEIKVVLGSAGEIAEEALPPNAGSWRVRAVERAGKQEQQETCKLGCSSLNIQTSSSNGGNKSMQYAEAGSTPPPPPPPQANRAEVIANSSRGLMRNDNTESAAFVQMNEHLNHLSERKSEERARGLRASVGGAQARPAKEQPAAVILSREEEGLMGLVESAESKLMRQSLREASRKSAARLAALEPPASESAAFQEPGGLSQGSPAKRKAMVSLLLKSPVFSRNTLDEERLDEVASSAGAPPDGFRFHGRKLRAEEPDEKCDQEEHFATMPLESSTLICNLTNMTNRLNEQKKDSNNNEREHQQQETAFDGRRSSEPCRGASELDTTGSEASLGPDVPLPLEPQTQPRPAPAGRRRQSCQMGRTSWATAASNEFCRPQEVGAKFSVGRCCGPAGSECSSELRSRPEDTDDHEVFSASPADEREGPTPTNDLVRALIHKDRLALGVAQRRRKPAAQSVPSQREAAIASRLEPNFPSSKPEAVSKERLKCEQGTAPSEERKRRSSVFDLSALISKCQRLQLSPCSLAAALGRQEAEAAAGAKQSVANPYAAARQQQLGELRCQSPRKPSDPSALLRARRVAEENLANLEAGDKLRRHSTYMLPIVLNSIAPRPGDRSSSSSSSGRSSSPGSRSSDDERHTRARPFRLSAANERKSTGMGHFSAGNESWLSGSELSHSEAAPSDSLEPDEEEEEPELEEEEEEDELDEDALMVEERDFKKAERRLQAISRHFLPNSASSPSALSTPTNERPRAGCEGACCCPAPAFDQCKQPLPAPQAQKQSPGRRRCESIRQQILARLQGHQQPEQGRRKRLGSNPLDRFRGEQTGKRPWKRLPMSKSAATRHSIISIFSHRDSASTNLSQNRHARLSSSQQQSKPPNHNLDANCEPLIPESGFKIVVMGTSGSGKTSIIQRFMYNSFTWRHQPTVEDTYFIEFPYMKNTINISISDTSGTYQFPAMRKLAINSGDAFILVYSVDNPQSFDDLETLRQTILDEREQAYLEAIGSINSTDLSSCSSSSTSAFVSGGGGGGANSASSVNCSLYDHHHPLPPAATTSCSEINNPQHHWSLASLFHNNNNNSGTTNNQTVGSINSSVASSQCPSSNCSSTENSRRSSVSAAEAALRTRRTRHPPMVIVANKHDLPEDQHLVNSDEMEALAVIDWNNGFVRASAALDWNISLIFQQVLKQARQPQTLADAIVSKRRKSLPPKLPHSIISSNKNSSINKSHNNAKSSFNNNNMMFT